MINLYRSFCSVAGIGFIRKGGGTVAALATCVAWYLLEGNRFHAIPSLLVTLSIIIAGIWCAGKVEKNWGKDSYRVVIDEVAGMCVSLLWIPVDLRSITIAFVLFRFFDIAKPLMIRKLEKLPGGWGVMADDLLAGLYANLVLQLIYLIMN